MSNDFNLVADVLSITPALKLVKRWCVINKYNFFECHYFKDLKSALKFFREHDGYYLRKYEVYE